MRTGRLEAFSDGVLAIIITIMVLELKIPHGEEFGDLGDSLPSLLTYLLSFIYIGIYWNNHHHLFQLVDRVDGIVLWANLHLLFWLSLVPFTTAWMDETSMATAPTVIYGVNLLAAALAYYALQLGIRRVDDAGHLSLALGDDLKGKLSPVLYVAGIVGALLAPVIGIVFFVAVALVWIVPDRRLEEYVGSRQDAAG